MTRGGGRGLDLPEPAAPRLHLSLSALPPDGVRPPLRLRVVTSPRIDPAHPLSGHKTTSALAFVLARRAARAAGADRALLLDGAGRVVCADAANLFAVVDGVLVTSPLTSGALPGISRGRVLALGADVTGPVAERDLPLAELARAREVFLTSSLMLVEPVASLDPAVPSPAAAGTPSGFGDRRPLTLRIAEALRDA